VVTCPKFKCKTGDLLFIIRNLKTVKANEAIKWTGYTFNFGLNDDRRPQHPFHQNCLHPPMMINTHCEELNETFNLSLTTSEDNVGFEAVRDIAGGETLMVDYGSDYNKELFDDRKHLIECRQKELEERKNRNHNFKCEKCATPVTKSIVCVTTTSAISNEVMERSHRMRSQYD